MRTLKFNSLVLGLLITFSFLFASCDDNDHYVVVPKLYKSWFTVKVTDDGSFYLQHDKGKTFLPVAGLKGYAPKKDHRAYAYYEVALEKDSEGYDIPIYVHYMDTILSKQIAENLYDENESNYGDDVVQIDQMWVGSGFLNVRFSTYWGGRVAHFVNLVAENDENPYELRFRHNAYDDPKHHWGYGWVAFDLSSLPSTENEDGEVELTIKIKTYDGMLEKKFTYTPGLEEEPEDPDDDEEGTDGTDPAMVQIF